MTIGTDLLPGIITDIESIPSVRLSSISNANVVIVGEGDVTEGEANANEPYTITRPTVIENLFGAGTPLSKQVSDALSEGAMPVYAVMTDEMSETQALDSLGSTSGMLDVAPAIEDAERITFTVDSTELTTNLVYDDPSTYTVGTDEAVVNPVTGAFELAETPTAGDIAYDAPDYVGALDSLQGEDADDLDAIAVISENDAVANELEANIGEMKNFHQLLIGMAGAGATVDTSQYSSQFDNSRMAIAYPTRNRDYQSVIGSLAGKVGNLGLNGSIMNKRLQGESLLSERLDMAQQIDLVEANVIPLASESQGALIVDDITSVADDNLDESEMDTIFTRLVTDHVTNVVKAEEEPFIGRLNKPAIRGALQALITAQLTFLQNQDAILSYNVEVRKKDANSAFVDVSIETIEPLRNIYNTIAAGQIN